ncbi:uncharacterized protein KY384_007243 [Bacidia gigantensis]|uniref:uncharacterized protein n=1 Tax=Bacidia gigantensis TaxID=2732470 RepID=UPI001D04D34E|nr:uncharacterized protein KY384_007243 [Bacidia gigantensis]KAG8528325.1 hypothetical protein KY384_007243 [Bacidia gigantensis]
MSTPSASAFMKSLHKLHPGLTKSMPGLKLVEEYDPEDLSDTGGGATQECAWVAERVVEYAKGVEMGLVGGNGAIGSRGTGTGGKKEEEGAGSAIAELKDQLAPEEKVGWWIIWNGDPERGDDGEGAGGMVGLQPVAGGEADEEEDGDGDVTPGAGAVGREAGSLPVQQQKRDVQMKTPDKKSSLEVPTRLHQGLYVAEETLSKVCKNDDWQSSSTDWEDGELIRPSISAPPGATVSFVPSPAPAPSNTTAPVPPLSDEATSLINDLKTVTLYASLIANGGFSDVLCSAINPTSLGDGTGINGTAVLSEICFTAAIQAIDPPLYPAVVKLNQEAVATKGVLETALFAVEAAAGYGGVTVSKGDLGRLYREIDEVKLGNLFIGFKEGRAKDVSGFVGRAAGVV